MMRRKFKIAPLVLTLVACALVGIWQAQGQRDTSSKQSFAPSAPASRPHADMTIRGADGAFVLKNLRLKRMGSSTILEGYIYNKRPHRLNQATFEIKAYDSTGALLRGVEDKTIFTAHRLKANGSAPLNDGYGVWLQGIALDSIARLEISEASSKTETSNLTRFLPFANHVVDLIKYSEIEE